MVSTSVDNRPSTVESSPSPKHTVFWAFASVPIVLGSDVPEAPRAEVVIVEVDVVKGAFVEVVKL